jgi:5-methylcytosine-specific restriction endonuclease McrA
LHAAVGEPEGLGFLVPQVNRNSKWRRNRRAVLFGQQQGKCYWCRCEMTNDVTRCKSPKYATFEHILPKSQGGRDVVNNIVLACLHCNTARADSLLAPHQVAAQ